MLKPLTTKLQGILTYSVPFIAKHRELIHKIGVTGGDVEKRIANAPKDSTYLLADVEIVATFKLQIGQC